MLHWKWLIWNQTRRSVALNLQPTASGWPSVTPWLVFHSDTTASSTSLLDLQGDWNIECNTAEESRVPTVTTTAAFSLKPTPCKIKAVFPPSKKNAFREDLGSIVSQSSPLLSSPRIPFSMSAFTMEMQPWPYIVLVALLSGHCGPPPAHCNVNKVPGESESSDLLFPLLPHIAPHRLRRFSDKLSNIDSSVAPPSNPAVHPEPAQPWAEMTLQSTFVKSKAISSQCEMKSMRLGTGSLKMARIESQRM